MRPRVSPRSVVAGRSGGPCDDGCEVQRVQQLKQSCSKSIPRGAEPGGTGCSVSAYSEFMALMQEPRGHKGNVPRFRNWSERSLLRCARAKLTSAVRVSMLPLLADVHIFRAELRGSVSSLLQSSRFGDRLRVEEICIRDCLL